LDKNGGRKQFGKLLHLPEKRKKKASPDKHSKINKKYQKYREQQEQQQQRHDMVVKEVDSLGHTLPNNQSPNNTNPDNDVEGKDDPNVSIDNKSKGVVKNPQKGPKVSCSECGKRVSSSDAKKLPCVLKNLHNGKKVTAGEENLNMLCYILLFMIVHFVHEVTSFCVFLYRWNSTLR
jgi:hypothetical protein